MLTRIFMTLRIFALFAFAFSPSMLLLVVVGLYTRSAWWFGFIGLPVLFGNGILVFIRPWRTLIEMELRRIMRRTLIAKAAPAASRSTAPPASA